MIYIEAPKGSEFKPIAGEAGIDVDLDNKTYSIRLLIEKTEIALPNDQSITVHGSLTWSTEQLEHWLGRCEELRRQGFRELIEFIDIRPLEDLKHT